MTGVYQATTQGTVTLTASTAKTVLQVGGATTTKVRVKRWEISFNGVTSADPPVRVRFLRQTSAGTASAGTPQKIDPDNPVAVKASSNFNATVEPTNAGATAAVEDVYVHPQGGQFFIEYPDDDTAPTLANSASVFFGIECTPGTLSATTVCVAAIAWRE